VALESVAAFCGHCVDDMFDARLLIAGRDYGRRQARGFCILLTAEAIKLFGEPMPNTIATMASVALGEPVEMWTVPKWCP
jgi:hypothetical protein